MESTRHAALPPTNGIELTAGRCPIARSWTPRRPLDGVQDSGGAQRSAANQRALASSARLADTAPDRYERDTAYRRGEARFARRLARDGGRGVNSEPAPGGTARPRRSRPRLRAVCAPGLQQADPSASGPKTWSSNADPSTQTPDAWGLAAPAGVEAPFAPRGPLRTQSQRDQSPGPSTAGGHIALSLPIARESRVAKGV